MKAVVAAFNQEKDLVGAFSVITNLRMELFEALLQYFTRGRLEDIQVSVEGHSLLSQLLWEAGDCVDRCHPDTLMTMPTGSWLQWSTA